MSGDERVRHEAILEVLTTPEDCEEFARRERPRSPDLAAAALRKAVELRAASHGAKSEVERDVLRAVYAYEKIRYPNGGRATRTWQMIERLGFIGAAERTVKKAKETTGYNALAAAGMKDLSFEAVVLRHCASFSAEAVRCSEARLADQRAADGR